MRAPGWMAYRLFGVTDISFEEVIRDELFMTSIELQVKTFMCAEGWREKVIFYFEAA
jgi:hypothetical protein